MKPAVALALAASLLTCLSLAEKSVARLGSAAVDDARTFPNLVALGKPAQERIDETQPCFPDGDDGHGSPGSVGKIPPPIPAAWREFIGVYEGDDTKRYVLEDRSRLYILAKGLDCEPLAHLAKDTFELSHGHLRAAERVTFLRDSARAVTGVRLGAIALEKRHLPASGEVFHITALKPVEQLRQDALRSRPPVEQGNFHAPDLVQPSQLDPSIRLDIRYATSRNFLSSPLYLEPRAYMQRPAAEAVVRVSRYLHALGYGLLIYDAYRPWYVTKMFWEGTPQDKRIFVADPAKGSRHNRGCAVDLTLYDLKTGGPVEMTGGYDEMSERSYPFYPGGTAAERWRRNLLRRAMEAEGFTVYESEWWHFDYKDWQQYAVLNLTFEQLEKVNF